MITTVFRLQRCGEPESRRTAARATSRSRRRSENSSSTSSSLSCCSSVSCYFQGRIQKNIGVSEARIRLKINLTNYKVYVYKILFDPTILSSTQYNVLGLSIQLTVHFSCCDLRLSTYSKEWNEWMMNEPNILTCPYVSREIHMIQCCCTVCFAIRSVVIFTRSWTGRDSDGQTTDLLMFS